MNAKFVTLRHRMSVALLLMSAILVRGRIGQGDEPQGTKPAVPDAVLGAVVQGTIRLDGMPPPPRENVLDELMARNMNQKTYRDETFLVGAQNGLQNCVVMLVSQDPNAKAPESLEKTFLDRVGVRYVPRVLVVTPGTEVVLRNERSPCRGFDIRPLRQLENKASSMIFEGQQQSIRLRGPDECSVTCMLRPYAQGYILVVNTPYYAVTDAEGKFRIPHVAPGRYRLKVWHESARNKTATNGPSEITVGDKPTVTLDFSVKVPAP